jgi:hypothetical protein
MIINDVTCSPPFSDDDVMYDVTKGMPRVVLHNCGGIGVLQSINDACVEFLDISPEEV